MHSILYLQLHLVFIMQLFSQYLSSDRACAATNTHVCYYYSIPCDYFLSHSLILYLWQSLGSEKRCLPSVTASYNRRVCHRTANEKTPKVRRFQSWTMRKGLFVLRKESVNRSTLSKQVVPPLSYRQVRSAPLRNCDSDILRPLLFLSVFLASELFLLGAGHLINEYPFV